jgi:hypothetical protein
LNSRVSCTPMPWIGSRRLGVIADDPENSLDAGDNLSDRWLGSA